MRLFLLFSLLGTVACRIETDRSPNTKLHDKTQNVERIHIHNYIFWEHLELNQFNTDNLNSEIVAPLGHATNSHQFYQPDHIQKNISSAPCFKGTFIGNINGLESLGTYMGPLAGDEITEGTRRQEYSELYKNVGAFGEVTKSFDNGLHDFTLNALPKNNEVTMGMAGKYFLTAWLNEASRLKEAPETCKAYKQVIWQVAYGMGFGVVTKLKFSETTLSSNEKLKLLKETFGKSEVAPEVTGKKLQDSKVELHAYLINFGGDSKKVQSIVEKLNCSTENVQGCRDFIGAVNGEVARQLKQQMEGVKTPADIGSAGFKAYRYVPGYSKDSQ